MFLRRIAHALALALLLVVVVVAGAAIGAPETVFPAIERLWAESQSSISPRNLPLAPPPVRPPFSATMEASTIMTDEVASHQNSAPPMAEAHPAPETSARQ